MKRRSTDVEEVAQTWLDPDNLRQRAQLIGRERGYGIRCIA